MSHQYRINSITIDITVIIITSTCRSINTTPNKKKKVNLHNVILLLRKVKIRRVLMIKAMGRKMNRIHLKQIIVHLNHRI